MKRDEMYYAREDVAFNAWLKPRRDRLEAVGPYAEAIRDLARSAFVSGARFGSEEAEIQAVTYESKAQSSETEPNAAATAHKAGKG